jgi:hypothetical protein
MNREWLNSLKVGDRVMIRWTEKDIPQSKPGIVRRLLIREIEVEEEEARGGRYGFRKTFKFRRSDGKRWPQNAYIHELWRMEEP